MHSEIWIKKGPLQMFVLIRGSENTWHRIC
uniref:Uncharacterized protein n=1 Tax=Arundo donax TaxID=35708 RepID=A0A0A9F7E2_ARUDO